MTPSHRTAPYSGVVMLCNSVLFVPRVSTMAQETDKPPFRALILRPSMISTYSQMQLITCMVTHARAELAEN